MTTTPEWTPGARRMVSFAMSTMASPKRPRTPSGFPTRSLILGFGGEVGEDLLAEGDAEARGVGAEVGEGAVIEAEAFAAAEAGAGGGEAEGGAEDEVDGVGGGGGEVRRCPRRRV